MPHRLDYPESKRVPVTDDLHGTVISDPYRWLEAGASPDVRDWTAAQNRLADEVFSTDTPVVQFRQHLRAAMGGETLSAPVAKGDRVFYLRQAAGRNQPLLCVRPADGGTERVVLDPNAASDRGTTALDWWYPSPDGGLVAFGYSANGDEWSTLFIVDVETGDLLEERIPRTRFASVAWEPDASGFYYTRYPLPGTVPAGAENFSRRVYYHKLGSNWEADALIFGEGRHARELVSASLSDCGRYLVIFASVGAGQNQTEVLLQNRQAGAPQFVSLTGDRTGVFQGKIVDGTLYLLTNWQAPRYRLVAADLANPAAEHWREVVPQQPDLVLEDFAVAGQHLVVTAIKDVVSHLYTVDRATGAMHEIPLPPLGSVTHLTAAGSRAMLAWESFTVPPTIYQLDAEGTLTVWASSTAAADVGAITVQQAFYTSQDGTRAPIFILQHSGLVRDGARPTVLTGYGGFNLSRRPAYQSTIYPWLEQGGIYALAVLRGGGEYGEEWHADGMLGQKQNVFDDFIAAAEYLIDAGYTRPEQLGIFGRSNGGLLVGAAMTQRPALFGAVVCGVPLLDMVRYHKFLIGALWISEYGSADDAEQFPWLHGYSPYHRVAAGTRYPATFLFAAESDTRVDPLHARKMTALLQHTAPDTPVLLRVASEAGHGIGKPLAMVIAEQAEIWGFLAWQLGLSV
ncbi:MAG: serine protease, family peptidase [Firmicutes bacterium]|nr:serine protease, family peptidase [Bacillota bacterium]